MSLRDLTVTFADWEIGVSVVTDEAMVREYIRANTGTEYSRASILKRSWCTDFAYWVLREAGLKVPPPGPGKTYDRLKNTAGYVFVNAAKDKAFVPQPGDLYYAHNLPALPNINHIGIVERANGPESIRSIDGNGGGDYSKMVKALGGGVVSRRLSGLGRKWVTEFIIPPYGD